VLLHSSTPLATALGLAGADSAHGFSSQGLRAALGLVAYSAHSFPTPGLRAALAGAYSLPTAFCYKGRPQTCGHSTQHTPSTNGTINRLRRLTDQCHNPYTQRGRVQGCFPPLASSCKQRLQPVTEACCRGAGGCWWVVAQHGCAAHTAQVPRRPCTHSCTRAHTH
jgi:hypothetical protein